MGGVKGLFRVVRPDAVPEWSLHRNRVAMSKYGWRGLIITGGVLAGVGLGVGAYFSVKFAVEALVAIKTMRGCAH